MLVALKETEGEAKVRERMLKCNFTDEEIDLYMKAVDVYMLKLTMASIQRMRQDVGEGGRMGGRRGGGSMFDTSGMIFKGTLGDRNMCFRVSNYFVGSGERVERQKFKGRGQTLSDTVPPTTTTTAPTAISTNPFDSAEDESVSEYLLTIEEGDAPTTIRVRLTTGKQERVKVSLTHTVGELFQHLRTYAERGYTLLMSLITSAYVGLL